MSIVAAFALPHPPILLPQVGHGQEAKIAHTANAYAEVARRIARLKPDVLLVASPHATLFADYFHISPGAGASGSLAQFHAPDVSMQVAYDTELARRIEKLARGWQLPAGTMGERDASLDHGTLIPLWQLRAAGVQCKVLRIGLSGLPALTHYQLGQCISEAVESLNRRAVFIASGDLSHKLTAEGPYGFAPEGATFDARITADFASGDFASLLSIPPDLAEAAAECGLRSFQMMAGVLDKKAVTHELLSYEGPFGVGYGIAAFEIKGSDSDRAFGERFERARRERLKAIKANEDAFVRLARMSLETFVATGNRATLPDGLPAELLRVRAGVFVSIKKDGQLRGCIGTISPATDSVALEILHNAVSAASHDPRFEPVREEELVDLVYSVDVLGDAELVTNETELDPKRYGVIVQTGARRGLLLPDLEGIDTVPKQLEVARRKAGIGPNENVKMARFEVVRHH